MHKSVHKSSVPDSYTLLLVIVKPYLFNVFCSHVRYVCMYGRGVMPIQSELSHDDFECSFQKTKNSQIKKYIFCFLFSHLADTLSKATYK